MSSKTLCLKKPSQSGQAVTEYILLLSTVIGIFYFIMGIMRNQNLAGRLINGFSKSYPALYRYGDARAKSFDDGGPAFHPRIEGGGGFRIFFNPSD